ncbi:MAG: hypothetical protein QM726_10790 [Chitinophagaceae bacterium]
MEDILDAEIQYEARRKTIFKVLQIFLFFTLTYLVVDIYREVINTEQVSGYTIAFVSLFMLIPLSGWILLWLKMKAGWIMSLFFYGFIVVLTGSYLVDQIMNKGFLPGFRSSDGPTYILFAASGGSIIFLSLKEIRLHLRITQKMHVWTLSIFGVIYSCLFIFIVLLSRH